MMWIYRKFDQFGEFSLFVWLHRWQLQLDVGTGIDIDAPCKVQGWEIRNCLGKTLYSRCFKFMKNLQSLVLKFCVTDRVYEALWALCSLKKGVFPILDRQSTSS